MTSQHGGSTHELGDSVGQIDPTSEDWLWVQSCVTSLSARDGKQKSQMHYGT